MDLRPKNLLKCWTWALLRKCSGRSPRTRLSMHRKLRGKLRGRRSGHGAAVLPAVPVAGMTTENLRSAVRLGGACEAPGADSPDSGSVICERGRSLRSSWAPGTCVVATVCGLRSQPRPIDVRSAVFDRADCAPILNLAALNDAKCFASGKGSYVSSVTPRQFRRSQETSSL